MTNDDARTRWPEADVLTAAIEHMATGRTILLPGATPAYFREQGRMFGYPSCCVEAFVADVGAGRNPAELRGVDGKNGCVPCAACASTQGWEVEEPPSSEGEG